MKYALIILVPFLVWGIQTSATTDVGDRSSHTYSSTAINQEIRNEYTREEKGYVHWICTINTVQIDSNNKTVTTHWENVGSMFIPESIGDSVQTLAVMNSGTHGTILELIGVSYPYIWLPFGEKNPGRVVRYSSWHYRAWERYQPVEIINDANMGSLMKITIAAFLFIVCFESAIRKRQDGFPISLWIIIVSLVCSIATAFFVRKDWGIGDFQMENFEYLSYCLWYAGFMTVTFYAKRFVVFVYRKIQSIEMPYFGIGVVFSSFVLALVLWFASMMIFSSAGSSGLMNMYIQQRNLLIISSFD